MVNRDTTPATTPLEILFVMHHAGFVRNYEAALRTLVARGHRIHIGYENNRNKLGENVLVQRLAQECPGITHDVAPMREHDEWGAMAETLRIYLDWLRYLEPRYARAAKLRGRVEVQVPRVLRWIGRTATLFGPPGRWLLRRTVHAVERAVPPSPAVREYLARHPSSMLLVTPLVDVGSDQIDYVREAARAGVPSALCVASWDNLTNKGAMRIVPDRVFLWNEPQKREAVELHGVPPDRVTVTGAQIFDQWFDWEPTVSREEFARRVGLPGERPFILYLGSSYFIAPTEADFASRWIAAIRAAADPVVANAEILVRPHPNNTAQWLKSDVTNDPRVRLWPPFGADPFASEFKHDFFHSLYYAGVVVGINTSAQIEAAILGRTVCTVRDPQFTHSQEGTLHFQHLAGDDGVLLVARDLPQHLEHLRQALTEPERFLPRTRRFVEQFVRPFGLDQPATPRLVEAIEDLATVTPQVERAPESAGIATALLTPIAVLMAAFVRDRHDSRPAWIPLVRPVLYLLVRLIALAARVGLLRPRRGVAAAAALVIEAKARVKREKAQVRRRRRLEQLEQRAQAMRKQVRRLRKEIAGTTRRSSRRARGLAARVVRAPIMRLRRRSPDRPVEDAPAVMPGDAKSESSSAK